MRNRSPLFLHLLFLCTSIAAPTEPKENATAAVELKCRDITSSTPGPDPTCWNTLKIDEWLQRWIIGPQACAQYEPWGNCFMRLTNNGVGGIDCLNIYDTKGCYPPAVGNIVPGAEIWYTAWSIWFLNHYLVKVATWDYNHQPAGFSANVPRVVNFLSSDDMPWINDTGLHRLDKGVAKIINDSWNNDTLNGDHKDDLPYNLSFVLWRTLKQWERGDFLTLAKGGGLLHSPL